MFHSKFRWMLLFSVFAIASPLMAADAGLSVRKTADGLAYEITDGDRPVLRYNYQVLQLPKGYMERVPANARIYAVPRCDYIHPLYGPKGEVLTDDWVSDHPHHRGIYWAWPEVDWQNHRGDLHALQHVFARPTGKIETAHGADSAQITAENEWQWENGTPIVRETAVIRAGRPTAQGRPIDLTFRFTAIGDDVKVARRGTNAYGGLNVRLSPAANEQIEPFCDPATASPRRSWAQRTGVPNGGKDVVGLTILQSKSNPDYPGDWVQYPPIHWIQPTFPTAGTRWTISKDRPLELRFRLWITEGKLGVEKLKELYDSYNVQQQSSKAK